LLDPFWDHALTFFDVTNLTALASATPRFLLTLFQCVFLLRYFVTLALFAGNTFCHASGHLAFNFSRKPSFKL
jgi:hypothetical protein